MANNSKYLVVQLARLGDLIQSKRLLLSLQHQKELGKELGDESASNPQVHLCVDQSLVAFAQKLFPFAQVHGILAHNSDNNLNILNVLQVNRKVFAELSAQKFDQVFNLNYSGLNFAIASLFDPETVKGYRTVNGRQERSLWAGLAWRWTQQRQSSPLNLADFWGLMADDPYPANLVNPIAGRKRSNATQGAQNEASGFATANDGLYGSRDNCIAVVLAGRESRRSLPPQNLALVLKAIFEGQGAPKFILLGTQAEQGLARNLLKYFSPAMLQKTENLTGKTSLIDLFELVGSCNQVISPDTGLMHLATHLGVPVQAFFLSSAWCWETGPYGSGHLVWQANTTCAPCLEAAPCSRPSQECLAPFNSPSLLAHLSGRHHAHWAEGLCGLVSSFDALGVCYVAVDGALPMQEERSILRALIGEKLALFQAHWINDNPKTQELVHSLFSEADWMLKHF